MQKRLQFFSGLLLSVLMLGYSVSSYAINIHHAPALRQYLMDLNRDYNFDLKQLEAWYTPLQLDQKIFTKMQRVEISRPIPWYIYRSTRITPLRIHQGVEFWQENATALSKAEKHYGVPASVIIAILGMETNYGKTQGDYEALNALTIFAFYSPRRRDYFRNELTQFLLLSRDQGWNPLHIKSSYDGGLGMPQFMPSSYRTYAVATPPKHSSDLFHNKRDTINSVANYLNRKGWQVGQPITMRAKVINHHPLQDLTKESAKPQYTLKEIHAYGLEPVGKVPNNLLMGILPLEGKEGMEYWLTFPNFSIVRTYNSGKMYAMAIYQLGKEISTHHHKYHHAHGKK